MQTLAPELRAAVLDELDWDRAGTVEEAYGRARSYVDDLLSLAVVCRSWSADAGARVRRIAVIRSFDQLDDVAAAGVSDVLETVVMYDPEDWFEWCTDGQARTFIGVLGGSACREFVGRSATSGVATRLGRPAFATLTSIHLMHANAGHVFGSAARYYRADDWNCEPGGITVWTGDAVSSLRQLCVCAVDYGDGQDDISLGPLLRASPHLRVLELRGVHENEARAVLQSAPRSLRSLCLAIMPEFDPVSPAEHHQAVTALVALIPPRLTYLSLGTSHEYTVNQSAQSDRWERVREQYLELANAFVVAFNARPATAERCTVHLCPGAKYQLDAGWRTGLATLSERCAGANIVCSLEFGAFRQPLHTSDVAAS